MDKFILLKNPELEEFLKKYNISDEILKTECYFVGDSETPQWFIPEEYISLRKNLVTADLSYIVGHLRYGHYELELSDEEYEEFKKMSKEDKKEYICENGKIIIDDYDLNDYGELINLQE